MKLRRYCPVFFTPSHWRYQRLSSVSLADPARTMRTAYARMRWGKGGVGRILLLSWASFFWTGAAILAGFYLTGRLGGAAKRHAGKARWRQFCEQLSVFWREGLFPDRYYIFELFHDHHRAKAHLYINRLEMKGALYPLAKNRGRGRARIDLGDKLAVHQALTDRGLPSARVLAVIRDGMFHRAGEENQPLPLDQLPLPEDQLFLKPLDGKGGRSAQRWLYENGGYRDAATGQVFSAEALQAHWARTVEGEDFLLQPCLRNHPDLGDLDLGVLMTARIISIKNDSGQAEITDAAVRMPAHAGSAVDNFHAGGIAAAIDIATGRLGRASDMGLSPGTTWHDRHPTTGGQIQGRILPCWREVVTFAQTLHQEIFDDRLFVGWDIAITPEGPVLIEANAAPGLDLMQRLPRAPLGDRRFAQIFASYLA